MLVDVQMKSCFYKISKWQKFLGIFSAVSVVFMILLGLLFVIFGEDLGSSITEQFGDAFGVRAAGVLYMVLGLVYIFPTIYLLNSAKKIQAGVLSDDEVAFSDGVKNMASLFKFYGILCIVCLILFATIIPIIMIAAFITAL